MQLTELTDFLRLATIQDDRKAQNLNVSFREGGHGPLSSRFAESSPKDILK